MQVSLKLLLSFALLWLTSLVASYAYVVQPTFHAAEPRVNVVRSYETPVQAASSPWGDPVSTPQIYDYESLPLFECAPDIRLASPHALCAYERISSFLAAENVAEGSFSITKRGWQGYPSNPNVSQPAGPFRLLQGAVKDAARNAATNANRAAHRADPSLAGKEIHEIQPVKLGGSPTDAANKVPLTPQEHKPFTTWWRQLQRDLER